MFAWEQLEPVFPASLVLGAERSGVSRPALEAADVLVQFQCLAWRIHSTSRPLPPFCFIGFQCGLMKLCGCDADSHCMLVF